MSSIYEFIDGEKANYSVTKICDWSDVSRSGFYEWRGRPASATAERRVELAGHVKRIFDGSDGTYGYRRVQAQMCREGIEAGPELVRSLMREMELVACQPRPYRTTTIADKEAAAATPDLLSVCSPPSGRAPSWWATSPTSRPGKAGCTWPR